MKEKKFELTDDMLDSVAGGATTDTDVPPEAKAVKSLLGEC